jgi:dephospho-CoA kinase
MIKVGVTGGIGSGKSTVMSYLNFLSFPVFYADLESKKILFSDLEVRKLLIDRWGDKVVIDGEIRKENIAKIVFSSSVELDYLTSILHPKVQSSFENWCEKQTAPIVFKEAAILFESGGEVLLDAVIHVQAPKEIRIKRVQKRDKVSRQEVILRMSKQWTDAQRNERSNYLILNNEDELIIPQIEQVLSLLLKQ